PQQRNVVADEILSAMNSGDFVNPGDRDLAAGLVFVAVEVAISHRLYLSISPGVVRAFPLDHYRLPGDHAGEWTRHQGRPLTEADQYLAQEILSRLLRTTLLPLIIQNQVFLSRINLIDSGRGQGHQENTIIDNALLAKKSNV